ncbi:unnamed protein product [Mucor hiemalis]
MDAIQVFNKCITWTRTVSLILSIVIVILSLSIYNYTALPILELLEESSISSTILGSELLHDMIQDRRFIATLVAAQASIFCPLFLLMTTTSPLPTKTNQFSNTEKYRIVIEQFCYFLMPFGLALSWVFCIIFDKKTEMASLEFAPFGYVSNDSNLWGLAIYLVDSLKYIIISVLVLEIVFIWMSSFEYARVLSNSQAIQLLFDEEEQVEEEKVLYV